MTCLGKLLYEILHERLPDLKIPRENLHFRPDLSEGEK